MPTFTPLQTYGYGGGPGTIIYSVWPDTDEVHAVRGNFLLCVVHTSGNPTISINAYYTGPGWTKLGQASNGTANTLAVFYKTNADDGYHHTAWDDLLALNLSASVYYDFTCWEIEGGNVITGTSSTGTGTNANGPSHTAPANAAYRWFSIVAKMGAYDYSEWSAPSGYTKCSPEWSGPSASGYSLFTYKDATAETEDPGAFTESKNVDWVSYTLALSGKEYANPPDVKLETRMTTPDTTNLFYGIKTWDADGNETLNLQSNFGTLLYSGSVLAAASGSAAVTGMTDKVCFAIALSKQAGGTTTAYCPHCVWLDLDEEKVYWEPASGTGITASDSEVLVFSRG